MLSDPRTESDKLFVSFSDEPLKKKREYDQGGREIANTWGGGGGGGGEGGLEQRF